MLINFFGIVFVILPTNSCYENQIIFFFLLFSMLSFAQVPHCGFDFTSYLVVKAHEEGKSDNIPDLKIFIVNEKEKKLLMKIINTVGNMGINLWSLLEII